MGIYQPILSLDSLQRGDIVRHKGTQEVFTVTEGFGSRVTAVRTADMTNASEWEVFRLPPQETIPAPDASLVETMRRSPRRLPTPICDVCGEPGCPDHM